MTSYPSEYDPLVKIKFLSELSWVEDDMTIKLDKVRDKLKDELLEKTEKKISIISEAQVWIRKIWEELLLQRRINSELMAQNIRLQAENERLNSHNKAIESIDSDNIH
jgi:hypothetical protein